MIFLGGKDTERKNREDLGEIVQYLTLGKLQDKVRNFCVRIN